MNGDDPEAVVFCARMAAEFRMRFGCDIVLDIVCYRRHGHNETDEPAFTQPIMYRAIGKQKTTRTLYAERLAAEGVVPTAEAQAMWDELAATLEAANAAAKSYKPNKADWLEGHWAGLSQPEDDTERTQEATGVDPAVAAPGRHGAGAGAGRLRREPEDRPPAGCQAGDDRDRRGHRLGHRRGAGVRHPADWRATASGCPARIASAARSASATPC